MKLRIATYNIHKGVSTIRAMPRVHALKQALASMQALGVVNDHLEDCYCHRVVEEERAALVRPS